MKTKIKSPLCDKNNCPYYILHTENYNMKSPVFSFEYVQDGFSFVDCEDEDKIAFLKTLKKLSALNWQQIQNSHRHGLGTEIIEANSIKPTIPSCVKGDTKLIAFRFNGIKAMVGFREKNIFYLLWIHSEINAIYHHS